MEHMLFIIQYTVKKSIISVFDDLRHRRPVVQPDIIAVPLWNGTAKSVDFGSANLRKFVFFATQMLKRHL